MANKTKKEKVKLVDSRVVEELIKGWIKINEELRDEYSRESDDEGVGGCVREINLLKDLLREVRKIPNIRLTN